MKNKEDEYKEIFISEALENFEEINRLLTTLEKNTSDKNTINALFRITHTLKGNASGMGFSNIAEMAHVLEDLFGEVREGKFFLDHQIFTSLYKSVDVLGELINSVKDNREVRYKGIKTKLEVLIARLRESQTSGEPASVQRENATEAKTESIGDSQSGENEPESDTRLNFSDLVQVPVRKLDNLLDLVGELVIEKDRILAHNASTGLHTSNEFARLGRISSDLQYCVMDVRLVQVGFLFNKFHRVVRDAASLENKDVVLKLVGSETEIDRNVLQVISDSLIHLVRNCVGHGIETAEERRRAGKGPQGTVWLGARIETDSVIIDVRDDGCGLNFERIKTKAIAKGLIRKEEGDLMSHDALAALIFEPGFSTVDEVNAISGRGVGMDAVKKTIESIGGLVKVLSEPGQGTTIQLTLPSSMAVKSCLLLELEKEVYAIPLSYTESVISLYKSKIHKAGNGLVASHQDKTMAIVFLKDLFEQYHENGHYAAGALQRTYDSLHDEAKLDIVVVSFNNRSVGFVVDRLLQQKEIVERPLMKPLDKIRFISGVTILGTGNVCLVLNVAYLLNMIFSGNLSRNSKNINSLN